MLGASLTIEALSQFQQLYQLLSEANQSVNLTRITTLEDFCTRHLLDSLTVAPELKALPETFSLIDIGSGAGFPALPLAIVFPKARIVAVESVQKKARFIKEASLTLGLSHVEVISERSEILAHQTAYRDQFDIATARAVSALAILAELCLPFVRNNGRLLAMKTLQSLEKEQPEAQVAIQTLGGKIDRILDVSTQDLPNRALVIIQKLKASPKEYPRKPGIPEKKPLH